MSIKNICVIALIFILSCKSGDNSTLLKEKSKEFFRIDIEELIQIRKVEKLSNLASGIDYIQLETNKDCLVDPNANSFLFTDSLIFINNLFHVLSYSKIGKFLGQICKYGRGPEENFGIASISLIPGKDILAIQSSLKMLLFTLDGKFIRSIKVPSFSSALF
jgi:hypothetical protein